MTMSANKILIADDDKVVHESLGIYLKSEGFEVVDVYDGKAAVAALDSEIALCVLDIMMPEMSGLDVCREIRKTSRVPVIMLTAKGEEIDRILGLELGADDYIVKPFSPREVVARIKAVLRRTTEQQQSHDDGCVFTREQLLNRVWGYDFAGETRTVDTHIKRIRAKLDNTGLNWSIKTIYGVGYKFEVEDGK